MPVTDGTPPRDLDPQLRAVHERLIALFQIVRDDLRGAHPRLHVGWPTDPHWPPVCLYTHYLSACYDPASQLHEDLVIYLVIAPADAATMLARFVMERGDGQPFGELPALALSGASLDEDGVEAVLGYLDRAEALYRQRRSDILAALGVPFDRFDED